MAIQPTRFRSPLFSRRLQTLAFALTIAVLGAAQRPVHPAAGQQAVSLAAGWTNIVYTGAPGQVGVALAPLGNKLGAIHLWDAPAQKWHSYFPDSPTSGDLSTMLPGQVYWIWMQTSGALPAGILSPAPTQIMPGWNNVVYFGPGAPGSSTLEQSQVWAWDSGNQRWIHRDPSSPATSDFQSLAPLTAYWMYIGNGQNTAATPPAGPRNSGCYQFSSMQPALADIDDAISRAGVGSLAADPQLTAVPEKSGLGESNLVQPPFVPPTILRAIGWVESGWHQASWATPRGQSGTTLASGGCAYGIMQLATGMSIDSSPAPIQQEIGTDYRANISSAVQLLTKNWNRNSSALPYVGQHDPHILEDWYFAVWAFHCFGPSCASYSIHDDPDDPSLPWPRPIYNSPDQISSSIGLGPSDYPYQEMVYGFVQNPPQPEGHPLWRSIAVQLPPHGSVGFPTPQTVSEASAHLEDGTTAPFSTLLNH